MKKVKILGKSIPILVLVLLGLGVVSAALLPFFGKIVTTANVEQAVTLIGSTEHTIPELAPGGEEFCYLHKIKNDASVDIEVGFETTPLYEGVTTGIYEVLEKTTLTLCEKGTDWKCVSSGATATLEFGTVNPEFDYTLTASGLVASTEYALIYYGDKDPRFNLWGGDNPGKVISTFTTDGSGNYNSGSQSVDLGMNLPSLPDWNINPSPDYCDLHNGFDDYEHCKGAKLWIVPVSDLTSGPALPLTAWHPATYLFETDLITYFDCNLVPEDFAVDMDKPESATITLMTKTKSLTPMLICYDFDLLIAPGTYTITTGIKPIPS